VRLRLKKHSQHQLREIEKEKEKKWVRVNRSKKKGRSESGEYSLGNGGSLAKSKKEGICHHKVDLSKRK